MGNQKKQYSAEFKQDAVNYYHSSGKSLEQVAGDLKVSKSAISKWVLNANTNNGTVNHRGSGNYSSDAEKEIARLKKELKDSKDALDILKKAIGILNN
ncbi:transposase [Tepidibacillus infernus]|uniref:transposase n=1 Tax=Tepidibacillus TaxID=1494427 RepID=UPI000852A972|nr:transposase [Tepidibacillus sp. HK-1]GBF12229.1 transposase [Tepidibacillus sp. HK-1]